MTQGEARHSLTEQLEALRDTLACELVELLESHIEGERLRQVLRVVSLNGDLRSLLHMGHILRLPNGEFVAIEQDEQGVAGT